MGQLISDRYAKALFDLAVESNKIDEFESQVGSLYTILKTEKDFTELCSILKLLQKKRLNFCKSI